MKGDLLQEVFEFNYNINELNEDGVPKKLKLNGVFAKYDVVNGNKRKYSKGILESAIGSVNEMITEKRMLGELDHPPDAKIHLDKVSHVVTKLELQPNGEVYGEAEVLPTANGKILESLIRSGVKLGVSSRGFGSTKIVDGIHEVQNDYKLVTFDIVADPSTPGAFPKAVYEENQKENQEEKQEENQDIDDYIAKLDTLDMLVEEILEEKVETDDEVKDYISVDKDGNRFYLAEGEVESYGNLNFHISHKYHILIKNEDYNEKIGICDPNLQLVEDIYGEEIISKIRNNIKSKGYNPITLNLIKEEF